MPEAAKPVYLVNTAADPVVVRVEGRACFQNSAGLRDFFTTMLVQEKRSFVLNLTHCTGMDSTFLGVLAGAALELRRLVPVGSLVICGAGPRNLELLQNLGLHRLLTVEAGAAPPDDCSPLGDTTEKDELANARLALEAHRNLVACDAANRSRFEDVLTFLQKRVEKG
ncbi:MAG: STAS domain-containing protein [Verrucomicrobiota bacterium]